MKPSVNEIFKILFFVLVCFLTTNCHSQNTFNSGYFINENNEEVSCLLKTLDWNNNPTSFKYKLSEDAQVQTATLQTVKEFGIPNVSKYVRTKVKIDRSSERIDDMSKQRNPVFREEVLFLKVLVEGSATLYQYLDKNLVRYFYKTEKLAVEQLVFKSYIKSIDLIATNNHFRQQIFMNMQCELLTEDNLKSLNYQKKKLINVFKKYNRCAGKTQVFEEPKPQRDFFNLSIRPCINHSSLTVRNIHFNPRDIIEYDSQNHIGLGIEAEIILPINKDKWAFAFEPIFQSFQSEKTIEDVSTVLDGTLKTRINHQSIEFLTTVRHYFLLDKTSKFFIDASFVFDKSMQSTFEYRINISTDYTKRDLASTIGFALGLGYKFKNKLSIQFRYNHDRNLLILKPTNGHINNPWNSNYRTFTIVFGYTFI